MIAMSRPLLPADGEHRLFPGPLGLEGAAAAAALLGAALGTQVAGVPVAPGVHRVVMRRNAA